MTVRRVSKPFAVVDGAGALRVVQPGDLFEDSELFAPPIEVPDEAPVDRRAGAASKAFGRSG